MRGADKLFIAPLFRVPLQEQRGPLLKRLEPGEDRLRNFFAVHDCTEPLEIHRLGAEGGGQSFDLAQADFFQNPLPLFLPAALARELLVQPHAPQLVEKPLEARSVVFDKLRVHAAFHGVEPEQGRGEAMDSADLAPLDLAQSLQSATIQPLLGKVVSLHEGAKLSVDLLVLRTCRSAVQSRRDVRLQPLAQAHFHLVGGFVGEGQGDGLRELHFRISHQKIYQPVHQQPGLSRARAGGHHDVAVESGRSALPLRGVRQLCGYGRHRYSAFLSLRFRCALLFGSLSTLHIVGR